MTNSDGALLMDFEAGYTPPSSAESSWRVNMAWYSDDLEPSWRVNMAWYSDDLEPTFETPNRNPYSAKDLHLLWISISN